MNYQVVFYIQIFFPEVLTIDFDIYNLFYYTHHLMIYLLFVYHLIHH
nr:MAG TPA: hypothetical protein [Crassvirales sp.]